MRQMIAALAILSASAAGAQQCHSPAEVEKTLQEQHGERIAAQGLTATGHIFLLYANGQSGSFTVVLIAPNGCAAVPAMGQAMHVFAPGVDG